LNDVLFPTFVDHDTSSRLIRLQTIFLVGTRLSLATVVAIGGVLILLAPELVSAWVGDDFSGSVIIVRLLAFTVIVRVANATANTLLKAAGRHRLVAFANLTASIVNITLSIVLVRIVGLVGVAIGTLVPVTVLAAFVIFPAGCRRVELPLTRVAIEALWPALWPAAVMTVFVEATLPLIGRSLPAVGAEMIAAAAVYGLTFLFFGVSARERRFYFSKLTALGALWRGPVVVSESA